MQGVGQGHAQVQVVDIPLTAMRRTVPRMARVRADTREEGTAVAQARNDQP